MSDSASVTLPDVTVTAAAPASARSTEPYAVRKLNFTFQLSAGGTFSTGSNKTTFTGLRATAHVEHANQPNTGIGEFRIWGMTLNDMNSLSRAGLVYKINTDNPDIVMVQAGDDVSGMATVYNGIIVESYPDMRQQEDASFYVRANSTQAVQLKPVPPNSFTGGTSVATALQQIIKPAGITLENNGVNAILASPYFAGSTWDQINAAVRAANCFSFFDRINGVLAIWPKTGSRTGDPLTISPANGMIGYPSFQAVYVRVRTLFNTAVSLNQPGKNITIQSELRAANGKFIVTDVSHDLASQMVDGPWETSILCTPAS